MDDSSTSNVGKNDKPDHRVPLGMGAFGPQEREQFGQNIRVAMECIEGNSGPVQGKAIPLDEASIRQRLKALFRAGKLSWSKVRLISRVADTDNERTLCHAALDASVSGVKRLCAGYRWQEDINGDAENSRALQHRDSRSLTWNETSNGSTRIQLILPPERAQAFLNSVEHSLSQLDNGQLHNSQLGYTREQKQQDDINSSMPQRRADAAVLMAETSLQSAARDIVTADRYQVIVSVDASALSAADPANSADTAGSDTTTPSKRPNVKGAGPIARETARRIACDCSLVINTTANGEPVDIGRKSRIWPSAMARAIRERDQYCVWPGCTQTHQRIA